MSKLEVDAIEPQSGTTLTIGASGDTVNIASGATITDFTSTGIDDNATSTAITIDSSENIFIGSGTDRTVNLSESNGNVQIENGIIFESGSPSINNEILTYRSNSLVFGTSALERMRITSTGDVLINNTSGVGPSDNGAEISGSGGIHDFARNSGGGSAVFRVYGSAGTMQVKGDGDVENTFGRYGSISDRTLKENETPANSQWNDIKALQIKNYNLIEFPNKTLIGVVAQDLEASGMNGLVDTNDEGIKSVGYSILYMKAVKALQEAMTRIETLETQRADLEARITTLENA